MTQKVYEFSVRNRKQILIDAGVDEQLRAGDTFRIPIEMDLPSALAIVGNLQLALRHPLNTRPSAKAARLLIDGIIQKVQDGGFPATAEIMRHGDNPDFDE